MLVTKRNLDLTEVHSPHIGETENTRTHCFGITTIGHSGAGKLLITL